MRTHEYLWIIFDKYGAPIVNWTNEKGAISYKEVHHPEGYIRKYKLVLPMEEMPILDKKPVLGEFTSQDDIYKYLGVTETDVLRSNVLHLQIQNGDKTDKLEILNNKLEAFDDRFKKLEDEEEQIYSRINSIREHLNKIIDNRYEDLHKKFNDLSKAYHNHLDTEREYSYEVDDKVKELEDNFCTLEQKVEILENKYDPNELLKRVAALERKERVATPKETHIRMREIIDAANQRELTKEEMIEWARLLSPKYET